MGSKTHKQTKLDQGQTAHKNCSQGGMACHHQICPYPSLQQQNVVDMLGQDKEADGEEQQHTI
jgi:hypothetical protein